MVTATKPATQVNYTPAMVARMIEVYTSVGTAIDKAAHEKRAEVVAQLSSEFKREKKSIISKLVSIKDAEGNSIYIKKTATSTVTKGEAIKKDEIASRIVAAFGVEVIDGKDHRLTKSGMEKANKADLAILLHHLNAEIVDEVTDEDENDSQDENLADS